MNWKNELITSASEGEAFLRRQLAGLNIPNLTVDCKRDHGMTFWSDAPVEDEPTRILSFGMESRVGQIVWTYVGVSDGFKGNGLGLMAAKCALGLAHEYKANSIFLSMVRHDGLGFWPTLGAVPTREPNYMDRYIDRCLKEHGRDLDCETVQAIKLIKKLAEDKPIAAWRSLSQSNIRLPDGTHFKQHVFAAMYTGDNFEINLYDEDTRAILTKRLGSVPDFRVRTHLIT